MSTAAIEAHPEPVRCPGLPDLSGDRLGDPAVVRWVAIRPSGEVDVRESPNRLGTDPVTGEAWQWALLADVYRLVDPDSHCVGHWTGAWRVVDDIGGIYIEPCGHPRSALPLNPVAARMIATLTGCQADVRGTVVWLGAADDDGIHAGATGSKVSELRELAAQARPLTM